MISPRKANEMSVQELNLHSMTNLSLCLIRFLFWEGGAGVGVGSHGVLIRALESIYFLHSEAIALARGPVAAFLCKFMYLVSPRTCVLALMSKRKLGDPFR